MCKRARKKPVSKILTTQKGDQEKLFVVFHRKIVAEPRGKISTASLKFFRGIFSFYFCTGM
jgi:hypothetical protein